MSKQNSYTGRGGQFAVMAEFVVRGYNVAIPEIDVGDDIFVVKDSNGDLSRVQVKTASGKSLSRTGCYGATFQSPTVNSKRRGNLTSHTYLLCGWSFAGPISS